MLSNSNTTQHTTGLHDPETLLSAYHRAKAEHDKWVSVWRDCYDFTCPTVQNGDNKTIYDATACDAVDELASVLMGEIIPRDKDWLRVDFKDGYQGDTADTTAVKNRILSVLRGSNLHMELHQAMVDVVVAGTGVLLIENPTDMGVGVHKTAGVQYTAVRPESVVLSHTGQSGVLDTLFRIKQLSHAAFIARYGHIKGITDTGQQDTGDMEVLESIIAHKGKWYYTVQTINETKTVVKKSVYNTCPFVAFRWQRSSDSIYGRSPVMKTLPDIKTANKVVELTLKNAAISVTGIWQADDDGVLNPYTVRLVPGAIIPKAVGSSGLQPLRSAGEFNVSNMVLDKLQSRIRKGLLSDVFTTTVNRTATEVQEHAIRARQVLNAVFERLTQECLTPLLNRSVAVMEQNGLIRPMQKTHMQAFVVSPMERMAAMEQLNRVQLFLKHVQPYGQAVEQVVDMAATLRWAADKMGVPAPLIQANPPVGTMPIPDIPVPDVHVGGTYAGDTYAGV